MNPNERPQRVIAVIGGIGSGKSSVCAYLSQRGFAVLDCDQIAREVASCPKTVEAVAKAFGEHFVKDGAIDRPELRRHVFEDAARLKKLNEIFHGQVYQRLSEALVGLPSPVFVEVSAADSIRPGHFSDIWEVVAEDDVRIARVTRRDNTEAEEVKAIIEKQRHRLPVTETIVNNDSQAELYQAVDALLRAL